MLYCIFEPKPNGDVAQLARALDWQSRGRGFESHLLHLIPCKPLLILGVCFFGVLDGVRLAKS